MLSSYIKYSKFYYNDTLRNSLRNPSMSYQKSWDPSPPTSEWGMSVRVYYRIKQLEFVKTSFPGPVSMCSSRAHPLLTSLLFLGLLLTDLLTFYSIAGPLQRLIHSFCLYMAHHGLTTSWLPVSAPVDIYFFPVLLNSKLEERTKPCSSFYLCCAINHWPWLSRFIRLAWPLSV